MRTDTPDPDGYSEGVPKVLLITAEQHMLQLLEAKFVEEGFEVATADGADGLELVQHEPLDLIVLEQRLVADDGRPLPELVRANERFKDIPLILLTVRDGSAGDEPSLSLPFRPKQLVALARDAL